MDSSSDFEECEGERESGCLEARSWFMVFVRQGEVDALFLRIG